MLALIRIALRVRARPCALVAHASQVRSVAKPVTPKGNKYKSVVVLFLSGGADSFNVVVPHSGCKKPPTADDDPTLAPRVIKVRPHAFNTRVVFLLPSFFFWCVWEAVGVCQCGHSERIWTCPSTPVGTNTDGRALLDVRTCDG